MADINSNKNAIIIQPITLQIRAPFQFLTNQRAIKRMHYSESRDGLNGCCSFSVVCAAREYTVGRFIQHKGCKVEQISPHFHLYLYLFFKFRTAPFFLFDELFHANMPGNVQIHPHRVRQYCLHLWLRRNRPFRFRRCF